MSDTQKLDILKTIDPTIRPSRNSRNMYLFPPTNIPNFNDYDSILTEPYSNALFNLPISSVYIVPINRVNRIDLISYDIYQDVRYWWLLCEYNYIYDPFYIAEGSEIYYPDAEDIANLFLNNKDLYIDKNELELTHEY